MAVTDNALRRLCEAALSVAWPADLPRYERGAEMTELRQALRRDPPQAVAFLLSLLGRDDVRARLLGIHELAADVKLYGADLALADPRTVLEALARPVDDHLGSQIALFALPCLAAMGRLAEPASLVCAAALARTHASSSVRSRLATALARHGGPAEALAADCIDDPQWEVRYATVDAFAANLHSRSDETRARAVARLRRFLHHWDAEYVAARAVLLLAADPALDAPVVREIASTVLVRWAEGNSLKGALATMAKEHALLIERPVRAELAARLVAFVQSELAAPPAALPGESDEDRQRWNTETQVILALDALAKVDIGLFLPLAKKACQGANQRIADSAQEALKRVLL